ncbi:hypothetical protein FOFC_07554 [Fusarium oxysporum]|nr:hypothetical protein FOFC_07554 [Fusarium oxysporum]
MDTSTSPASPGDGQLEPVNPLRITDEFSSPIEDRYLQALARILSKLDVDVIESVRLIYETVRAQKPDMSASEAATIQEGLPEVEEMSGQFKNVVESRRRLGMAYLTEKRLAFYWQKYYSLLSQILRNGETGIVPGATKALRWHVKIAAQLPNAIVEAAVMGVLGNEEEFAIAERWTKLDQMIETSKNKIPDLAELPNGGGIRGISSLLVLEHIMEKIQKAKKLDEVPRPCDYFDLIGGTSTGGIIAIMLGRLRMTVDECIRAYKKVAQQAFTPKRTSIFPASPSGTFSATQLEAAIKQTVREFCVDPECIAQRANSEPTTNTCQHSEMEFRDVSCRKTVVLAITKDNVDAPPTLFTTYDTSADLQGCTIWQVARVTSAATTFFKSIRVGRDDIEFIDAGFGYNNPCEVLIEEAQRQFPSHGPIQMLSIGTGLGDVVAVSNTRKSILKALQKMATTSKKVALRLDSKFGDDGEYYRFNVDRGLEDVTLSDWELASTISAHTKNYLAEDKNQRAIKKFVDTFVGESAFLNT